MFSVPIADVKKNNSRIENGRVVSHLPYNCSLVIQRQFLERSAVHLTPGKIGLMHFKLPRVVLNWLAASFFLVSVSSDHQSMMWDIAFVLVHIHLHTQRHMVCFLEVIFSDVRL